MKTSSKQRHPIGTMSLEEFFQKHPKVAIAFSGGSDSSYLLAEAMRRADEVKAYFVNSVFQPPFEVEDAKRVAQELGANLEIIEADVLSRSNICANGADRCYHCKRFIFSHIIRLMNQEGYRILIDGTNASDDPTSRPGFKALYEMGVQSPLRLAGLTKDEVRENARKLGVSTADKPRFACLATKIPKGTKVTQPRLDEVLKEMNNAHGAT